MNDVDTMLNRLCHLMVAFEHVIGDLPDEQLGRVRLDTPGLAVLVSLDLFGEMRPTSIAQLLGGSPSMATKVVGRLAREGHVERHHGTIADDRRAVTVQLSDRGRAAIGACEVVLADLSVDLIAAMIAVEAGAQASVARPSEDAIPGGSPPATGPALAEFLRFVIEIDKPLLATLGGIDVLHPNDPRGLLVLSELDRGGPQRVGSVPTMIDRSRSTAHRLCAELEALGLVGRAGGAGDGDQRQVVLEITDVGRAVLRGAVAAVTAHLPDLRPSMRSLDRALHGERQSLGAPIA